MFNIAVLLVLPLLYPHHFVDACAKTVEFTACTTAASMASADCNTIVTDTPGLSYYQCLCSTGQDYIKCYALCKDDAQLQLQLQLQNQHVSASCQAVSVLQAQGYTTTASTSGSTQDMVTAATTSSDGTSLTSSLVPASKPSITPRPLSTSTSVIFANGDGTNSTSTTPGKSSGYPPLMLGSGADCAVSGSNTAATDHPLNASHSAISVSSMSTLHITCVTPTQINNS
ncbi:hypothetical protein HDU76_009315, partial [Blyttiomyces sp. JEL0837]